MTDPGLLDLASPALAALDGLFAERLGLAAVWRIAFFALLGGLTSMLLFKWLSNQAELAALKARIAEAQAELARTATDGRDLAKLIRRNLALSGRRLLLSLWPALVASIPVLFLLAFCSNQFGSASPAPGSRIFVTPQGVAESPADFAWRGVNAQWDARRQAWTFYYPEPGHTAILLFNDREQFAVPTAIPARLVHKRRWWNRVLANPAGYVAEHAVVDSFLVDVPEQRIIDWGPGWMRGWLFAFLLFLLGFSVVIKVVWRIH